MHSWIVPLLGALQMRPSFSTLRLPTVFLADGWPTFFSERWIAIGQKVKRKKKRDEMFFVSLSVFGFVISTII